MVDLQRRRERPGDRPARRLRGDLAHRHVLYRRAADGLGAVLARSAAVGWRHRLLQHVPGLRDAAGRSASGRSRAASADTTPAATAPANCAAALSTRLTRAMRSAPTIRSSAPTRSPAARRCSSAAGATPIFRAAAGRERGAAGRAVGARHQAGIRLVPAMAGRRSDPVG